ncbi:MAG: tetratricopeptide repeat protein [Polyangiaceae bacterium]|jgi:hypothetical protein
MADLRPGARALIRAGKTAFRPQAEDRERVLQSLTRTLGEGATFGAVRRTEPPPGAAGPFPVASWVLGGLGALAVGAGILVATHPWMTTPSRVQALAAPALSTVEPLPSSTIRSVNADDLPVQARIESPSVLPRPAAPPSAARFPSDSLPEEVRLLSKAEQQISAGHPEEALTTLGEHERRFPGGALAEERLAARVQSLCALGRVHEARTYLATLARAYPGSPHFDRARRFCGIDMP